MKLLYCSRCRDVIRIEVRSSCRCKKTKGRYLDNRNAEFEGEFAVPLGIDNAEFVRAVRAKDNERPISFRAFRMEDPCPTFRRKT